MVLVQSIPEEQATANAGKVSAETSDVLRLPWFIRRRLGLLSRWRIPFGQTVRMKPWEPSYMLADEHDIYHVLVANDANYVKTPNLTSEAGRARAGNGLLTSTGDRHRFLRRGLAPMFKQDAAAPMAPTVLNRTHAMLETWNNGESLNIANAMTQLGLNILLGMMFGDQYVDQNQRFTRAITARRRYNEYIINGKLPFRSKLPTPTVKAYQRAIKEIDQTFHDAIQEKRQATNVSDGQSPSQMGDLLSMFMRIKLPDGSGLTDAQIRDEMLTLTTAGYETVADGLTWTQHLLAQHPDVQAWLHEEISNVLGGRAPMASDYEKLSRTLAVLSESWRLYPPTWIYVRTPLAPDKLPSGTAIPTSARLYLCPYVMHRHPRFFDDPQAFKPKRFEHSDAKRLRGVYFPFGDGPHVCIGAPLAKLQSVLTLASIVQRYKLTQIPGHNVTPYAGVTLRPRNGAWLIVHTR